MSDTDIEESLPPVSPEDVQQESAPAPAAEEAPGLQEQFDALNDKYLRMLADTENFKKRVARERTEERNYAAQETILAVLPLADNLGLALQAAKKNPEGSSDTLVKGVELSLRHFEDILRRMGVEVIPAETGKPFDPNLHQALFQEEHAEFDDGSVLDVMQKGYRIGDRVIRPAMVKVSRKP